MGQYHEVRILHPHLSFGNLTSGSSPRRREPRAGGPSYSRAEAERLIKQTYSVHVSLPEDRPHNVTRKWHLSMSPSSLDDLCRSSSLLSQPRTSARPLSIVSTPSTRSPEWAMSPFQEAGSGVHARAKPDVQILQPARRWVGLHKTLGGWALPLQPSASLSSRSRAPLTWMMAVNGYLHPVLRIILSKNPHILLIMVTPRDRMTPCHLFIRRLRRLLHGFQHCPTLDLANTGTPLRLRKAHRQRLQISLRPPEVLHPIRLVHHPTLLPPPVRLVAPKVIWNSYHSITFKTFSPLFGTH